MRKTTGRLREEKSSDAEGSDNEAKANAMAMATIAAAAAAGRGDDKGSNRRKQNTWYTWFKFENMHTMPYKTNVLLITCAISHSCIHVNNVR